MKETLNSSYLCKSKSGSLAKSFDKHVNALNEVLVRVERTTCVCVTREAKRPPVALLSEMC